MLENNLPKHMEWNHCNSKSEFYSYQYLTQQKERYQIKRYVMAQEIRKVHIKDIIRNKWKKH